MRPPIREICATVAAHYGLEADALLARDRHKSVWEARSIAIWLARRKYGLSYPELGREFGLDHTSCINSVQRVEKAGGLLRITADGLAGRVLGSVLVYQADAARMN